MGRSRHGKGKASVRLALRTETASLFDMASAMLSLAIRTSQEHTTQ
jgi:Flp pilus assembly protein CpaB